jgi:hypothetical protein
MIELLMEEVDGYLDHYRHIVKFRAASMTTVINPNKVATVPPTTLTTRPSTVPKIDNEVTLRSSPH